MPSLHCGCATIASVRPASARLDLLLERAEDGDHRVVADGQRRIDGRFDECAAAMHEQLLRPSESSRAARRRQQAEDERRLGDPQARDHFGEHRDRDLGGETRADRQTHRAVEARELRVAEAPLTRRRGARRGSCASRGRRRRRHPTCSAAASAGSSSLGSCVSVTTAVRRSSPSSRAPRRARPRITLPPGSALRRQGAARIDDGDVEVEQGRHRRRAAARCAPRRR